MKRAMMISSSHRIIKLNGIKNVNLVKEKKLNKNKPGPASHMWIKKQIIGTFHSFWYYFFVSSKLLGICH